MLTFTLYRDSHDPTLATRQILAIAPILKGQEVSHEFDIPAFHQSKQHTETFSQSDSKKENQDNLIDFGGEPSQSTMGSKPYSSNQEVDLLGGSDQ